MRRCFYLLPLLIFSIAVSAFSSSDLIHRNQFLNVSPTATPRPAQPEETDEIVLDKKVVCHPCPPGRRPFTVSDCGDNMLIAISVGKSENKQLGYEYTVSGGQIVGEGAKVIWDMTGVRPGTYQIRIGIEDKLSRQKRAETKMITVSEGDCGCGLCVCPALSVDAPTQQTKVGEIMTFIANVSGGSADNITYNWKVSAGEIIEGQGTPAIKVATNAKMAGKTIKATVEIEGVCEECPKSESAEASIVATKTVKKKN